MVLLPVWQRAIQEERPLVRLQEAPDANKQNNLLDAFDPETPEALRNLDWNDMFYLCRVATFPKIERICGATISFPQLEGKVSMYEPQQFLGRNEGVSIVIDPSVPAADAERIAVAWDWLV
ncbi:hypothetical protein BGX26_011349 [Mortierella sp. AD094]|nr:hypothetical protein BGX26_011349 [Mortierella sp. AD094]